MTREEQILKAGIEYTIANKPKCIAGDNFKDLADIFNKNPDFEAGAKWADEHPRWISVKDELPKLIANKLLFDYSDDVLVYLKDGSITVGRWERDNSTGEQYWLLDIDKDVIVTHWMPLPQEPKKGGEQ